MRSMDFLLTRQHGMSAARVLENLSVKTASEYRFGDVAKASSRVSHRILFARGEIFSRGHRRSD